MAGSEELVNLGLFADRSGAYRMLATEGIFFFFFLHPFNCSSFFLSG